MLTCNEWGLKDSSWYRTPHYRQHVVLKPNSITLAGSKLIGDQLRTSFEPDSVMEFGFYYTHPL